MDQEAGDMIWSPQAGAGAESSGPADELSLIAALRSGDERAFETLIDRYHGSLLRLAMLYVPSHAVAEEVVQETWLGVLQGLGRFEGRSSLKTWLFRILTNRARTRGQREGRSIPFSAVWNPDTDPGEPAVEPERFRPREDKWHGGWKSYPHNWDELPEERLLSAETRAQIQQAIDALPDSQREVITLRDIEGWASEDVCNVLGISESNQRVLLHRARSKVRRALERYLDNV
ncbi:MAG TPA: sigma-70 family RNA polymerase sigma factor [Roseiflexaceae bacterium]|nr:sigma-70 family RNA polymerase sigma factor [Roseiflexaceae bacterium]